jgi:hypothetical protein
MSDKEGEALDIPDVAGHQEPEGRRDPQKLFDHGAIRNLK